MIDNKEIVALIPAKDDSKRIKNKNFQTLSGKSLIGRKILQLQQSKHIDRIVVGSKSEKVLDEAKKYGAETITEHEYEYYQSANKMIHNLVTKIQTDIVLWAHATNPFISASTYDKAIKTFQQNLVNNQYDSLLSVYKIQEHFWTERHTPLNYNPYGEQHTLAKDLPPIYAQDGGIFIQPYQQMLENSYFFGKKPYLFQIDEQEIFDINVEKELYIAKALAKYYD
ncbi:cytidylyltransferase domain-containing protein [Bathymodiolus thermophilus thioautotrophic gill symbiont]|uniref:Acylneuraminate cytidylyltransferase n=1 Tax=Bathymodiolus thermophilus thioautotrophic gill symbiont TaxID=2360 RepID=A0A1J5TZF6_9GAMM|nr:NTP transferase domain-containing protein [Bathymodiolus thermophilus thioautotrophic gill symbiont]OIR25620.1 hypothetical protein BGC33_07300 [Bathymodiolus thermophilus thioautotrophic gill symbiont]